MVFKRTQLAWLKSNEKNVIVNLSALEDNFDLAANAKKAEKEYIKLAEKNKKNLEGEVKFVFIGGLRELTEKSIPNDMTGAEYRAHKARYNMQQTFIMSLKSIEGNFRSSTEVEKWTTVFPELTKLDVENAMTMTERLYGEDYEENEGQLIELLYLIEASHKQNKLYN